MFVHMARTNKRIPVYLEIGKSKAIAAAIDWPGWCRIARNEDEALQALRDYGSRYAQVMKKAKLPFTPPKDVSALHVVERIKGNATTDFGAPALSLERDAAKLTKPDLKRYEAIMQAIWHAFDQVVKSATGASLLKGPRGGGRDLDKIVQHVLDVDLAYLKSFSGITIEGSVSEIAAYKKNIRNAISESLALAVEGKLAAHGPRGGQRWPAHYFVRRLAWHELDHVWEIEDRVE